MTDHYDVAVIGAGGAGTMAYLRAVLNGDRTVVFTGDAETKRKGRATWVAEVDNMPGLHDVKRPITATTKSTMKWVDSQPEIAAKQTRIAAVVSSLSKGEGGFSLTYRSKKSSGTVSASHVIVATGIMDVQPHIGGTIKPILPFANRYDVLYCIRCDGHKTIGKNLSMIGANDTTIGIAAMMVERYDHKTVNILTNNLEESFSDKSLELSRAYDMKIFRKPIVAVRGDPKKDGLEGYELEGGEFVETNCSIVALGIIPYNQLLQEVDAKLDDKGRALVSEKYETSVDNLFVVGDLVAGHKMQIYTAWDEAVDAADEINRRLRSARRKAKLEAYRQNSA